MTSGQARIVDPILTTHSRGYKNPDVVRVGKSLFPVAPVASRGSKIIKFDKQAYRQFELQRARGTDIKQINVGYSADTVSLKQFALAGQVTVEELEDASQVPGIDLQMQAVDTVSEVVDRDLEIRQATIAQAAGNYDTANKIALTTTDCWDDYTNSDPGAQMDDAHQQIRRRTGRRGNTLILGPLVAEKARRHPKIVGHFYTGALAGAEFVDDAQLAKYFRVRQVLVGDDVYLPNTAAEDADFVDIWGNVAILAFVPTGTNINVPSFGYTYQLKGYPAVEQGWYDRNKRAWVYPYVDENQPVLTGMDAGYLFTGVLAG
jgi:hypothetical protein